jgi:catechol 2,3-dioxygenase-like lactoylglutathione lyase family enzyme
VFQAISAVSFAVRDLPASESAFRDWLGYRTVASGQVPAELTSIWDAPQAAGRRFVVMEPESGEPVFLRLLEAPAVADWAPLRTFGWNAAELHVQDVQGLAKRLGDSPFTIIGAPRDLLKNGAAIAMQVRGPADEVLYLTELNGKGMRRTYGEALSPVGRVFIAVLGARDHAASMEFYERQCRRLYDRGEFPIRVLANAYGLDPETAKFNMGRYSAGHVDGHRAGRLDRALWPGVADTGGCGARPAALWRRPHRPRARPLRRMAGAGRRSRSVGAALAAIPVGAPPQERP